MTVGPEPVPTACRRCGGVLGPGRRSAATVALGPVEVAVPVRTVPSCPRGHRGGEAVAVRAALDGLVRARPRPVGGPRCGVCRTVLDLPERTTSRAVTVETVGVPPYTLELRLPLVRCPDCAVDNVPVGVMTLLRRATRTVLG